MGEKTFLTKFNIFTVFGTFAYMILSIIGNFFGSWILYNLAGYFSYFSAIGGVILSLICIIKYSSCFEDENKRINIFLLFIYVIAFVIFFATNVFTWGFGLY